MAGVGHVAVTQGELHLEESRAREKKLQIFGSIETVWRAFGCQPPRGYTGPLQQNLPYSRFCRNAVAVHRIAPL
jgi:hypothetical protein